MRGRCSFMLRFSEMKYFDAHCHIQFEPYDEDRTEVLARMREAEVGGMLVGTGKESSESALTLADGQTLFASAGLHPNHVFDEEFDASIYESIARDAKVVAIGECGLDFYRPENPELAKEKQVEVFRAHIRLAKETGKPLMVHARPSLGTNDAYETALEILAETSEVRANFHFFVGSVETARKLVEAGHTCSFTAVLAFTHDYDEVVRFLPLTNILTETDAPYASPPPNRGQRNEPTAVIEVVKAIARIRGEDEELVRKAVLTNARRVFGLP